MISRSSRRFLPRASLMVAAALLGTAPTAQAAILTWDNDGVTTAAQGGTGTWTTNSGTNWWNGTANVVWPAVAGTDDDAVFAGTAGTVTIAAGGVTANDLTFNTTGYTITGGTLTLNGTTPTLTAGTGVTTTLTSVIAGSSGLTKAGAGTLTLNGSAANTFTGGVTVNGGTLDLNFTNFTTPTDLIASGNSLTINGGTFRMTGSASTVTSQTFNGTSFGNGYSVVNLLRNSTSTSTTLSLGTVTASRGTVVYFNTSTALSVTASTTEMVKVSNAVSAAGNALGTWAIGGGAPNTSSARWVTVDAGGVLRLVTANTNIGSNWSTVNSQSQIYTASAAVTLASNPLAQGIQNNAAANSTIGINLQTQTLTTSGLSVIPATVVWNFSGSGAGNIRIGSQNQLVIMGAGSVGISVPITEGASPASVTNVSGGSLTLSGANTFSGGLATYFGILNINSTTALGAAAGTFSINGGTIDNSSAGAITISNNNPLTLNGDFTFTGTQSLNLGMGAVSLGTAPGTSRSITVTANTLTIGGVIADGTTGTGITKAGAGILVLSGKNTYSGPTVITNGGTTSGLLVTSNNALGSTAGTTTVGNVASLGLSGGINYSTLETIIGSGAGLTTTNGAFAAGSRGFLQSVSGNNTFAGSIQVNAAGVSRLGTQNGAQLTLSGPITMSGVVGVTILFRVGSASGDYVTLTNNGNSWDSETQLYTDAAANSGLRLGISNAIPTGTTFNQTGGAGLLDLASFNQELNGLSGAATRIGNSVSGTTSILTLNNSATRTTSGVIQDGGAGGSGTGKIQVVKIGTFTQTLQGQSTYTGGTLIKNGALKLESGNDRLLATGTVTLGDTATTGRLILGETATARNQTLAGLSTTGMGGSVVGASTTGHSILTLNLASNSLFDGTLGGAGANENQLGLTKTGAGTLTLSGVNTYAGPTTISSGILQPGSAQGLSSSSAFITADVAGATLELNGQTSTIGSLSGGGATGGNVTLGAATLTTGADGTNTVYGGNITGTGNLVKSGTGVFTLSSAQAYTGATSVNNGTLLVNNTLASSGTTVASGATLGGTGTLTNAVTINAGGTLSPATTTTAGTLNIGSLTLEAGSLLNFELGGTPSDLIAVTTPSGLTINGGALSLYATGGLNSLTTDGTYTLFTFANSYAGSKDNLTVANSRADKTYSIAENGNTLQLIIGTATTSAWSGTAGDGLWTTAGVTGNWTGATAPATLGAVVSFGTTPSAATTVTLDGAKTVGSIIFNNTFSYTIGTTADALTLDNGIAAGAISVTAGSHTINAPIVLNGPANIVPAATTSLTFGGAISGAGKALTFSGAGVVTLGAANTFGSTVLSAGTLNLGHDGALGSSLITISGGTIDAVGGARTLSGNNPLAISGDFAFTGTNDLNFGTGAVSLATTRTLSVNAGRITIGGAISGAGLTKAGTGTLVLSGTNTYTGATTITGGTLIVDLLANGGVASNIGQSSNAAANLVLGASTLRYTGATANTNRAFSLSAGTANTIEVSDTAANLTLAGASAASTASLTKSGPGVLTISGANGYTGATTVSAGRLALQGTSASTSYAISAGSVLELNSAVTRDYPAASFNGLGTLRKTGGGEVFWGAGAATFALGSGSLIDVQEGTFKGGSYNNEVWINNLSDLNVVTGAIFAGVEANVRVNKITGAGRIQTGYSGYLNFTIGVDNGSSTFDGTIENTPSYTGNIAKTGSGTIILTGANTYSGTTTVSAGTLTLSGNRTVNAGSVTVGNLASTAATLNIQSNLPMGTQSFFVVSGVGATATVNQIGGNLAFTGGNAILIGNTTGGSTGIYNLSGGTITTYASTNRGVILGVNNGAAGSPINATFNLSGTGNLNNATGALQVVRGEDVASYQNSTYNQTGGNSTNGTLIIGGSGTSGANSVATFTITGGTFSSTAFTLLSAGNNVVSTLTIGGTADVTLPAFPTARGTGSTATLNFNGGTLKPAASSTAYLGGLTNAFIQAGGAKFDTNNFDITVSQALLADIVSTGGGLTKAGNGVLTLSGANTFTGGASIEAGVLALGSATAFNATAGSEITVTFGAGSTGALRMNGNSVIVANLTSNATPGSPIVENAAATNATLTVGNSANLGGNFAGVLRDGTGVGLLGLTKAGNGTLTLSGANTYSGSTTISAGILAAGAANAFSANSDIVLADNAGAILSLNGFAQTIKSLNGGGATGGSASLGIDTVISVNGTGSFGGVISGTGSSGLTKAGTGTQTLTGTSTYSGATSVTGGTLALSGTGSVNASSGVTINGSGASFAHTGSVAVSAPVTLTQGSINGTGTINALTVASLSSNALNPGTSGTGTLTVGALDFLGAARIDFTATGSVINGLLSTNSLNTNGSENVFVNIAGVPLGGWSSGTYDLISYDTLGGSGFSAFKLGTLAGRTPRTTPTLINQSGKISLSIINNIAKWSGVDGGLNAGTWEAGALGNWKLSPSGTAADYIEGEAVIFDDTATGTTIVTIGSPVAPSSVTFNNSTKDYTLDGAGFLDPSLQQTVGLIKNGTGKLTINAANLYSGATVINAGNITMGMSGSLGQDAPLTLAGGQLDLGATDQTVGDVSITAAAPSGLTIDNGSLESPSYTLSNASGNALIGATLSGINATLIKNGAGNATLSAANTFSGAVTVNAGTLIVTSTGSLGATSAINLAGGSLQLSNGVILPTAVPLNFTGGSLDLGTSTQAVGAVSVTAAAASGATIANGSLTGSSYAASNATGDAVINAALLANGAIGFTKTGNGRVTLGGANTYTGTTTVSAGTLAAGSSSAFTGLSALAISGNATFDLNGYNATFSGDVTTAPATVTITDTAAGSGTSTIRFQQTSNTTIITPTLIVDGPTRKVGFALTNNNGAQQFTNAANTFSGGITLLNNSTNGTRMQVGAAPNNTFVSGVLTASPYGVGPITIGQIATDKAGIFVSAANTTIANAIVFNTGLGTDRAGMRYDSTGNVLSGTITANNAAATFSTNTTGAVTLSGRVTGANGLTLDNTFGTTITVTLNNVTGFANDYRGETRIAGSRGILVLGASDQIPNGASAGNLNASGSFRLQGFSDTINGLSGNGNVTTTVAGASVLTLGDGDATASFGGTITESVGTIGLAKIGAGTQTLTTSLAYTGGTTVTAGTLALGHATNTLADTGTVTVNGGTLSLGANSETVGAVILSSGTLSSSTGTLTSATNFDLRGGIVAAILGGSVGLNKTTTGTTTVTSVNAFTGATSVSNGTLRLSGAGDINSTSGITINGAGAKFVQSSSVTVTKPVTLTQGILTGSGTVNTVNAGTGGIITNNDGLGGAALTIGTLTLSGGANLNLFSDGTSLIPLTITSLVNNAASGAVTITANNSAGWINGTTYDVLSYGSVSGTGSNSFSYVANNKSARQTETWSIVNSTVKLTIDGTKPYWTGAADGKWNTTAAGNWKLLADNNDTLFLPSDDVLFDDNAGGSGTVTVDIDQADVVTSLTLFENSTRDYFLTGAFGISAGSLTKTGEGRLTVTNVNTYQGTTSINRGTLVLTGAGTLGSGGPLVMGGGSLDLDATSKAFGTVSITAPASTGFTIGNGSLTGSSYSASNATGTAIISANLLANGSAGFTKTGAGAVTLSGANTFTGGFMLNAGTVNVGSAGALGAGAVILSGGALDGVVGSPAIVANGLTINGDFAFVGSSDLTISGASTLGSAAGPARIITVNASNLSLGVIANGTTANNLNKAGLGTLVLSGANTYTGVTNVQNGTLRLTGSLPVASTLVLGNNTDSGKFALGSTAAALNQTLAGISIAGTGTSNAIVGGNASVSTVTLSHTAAVTYAGSLGGAGTNENNLALIKSGTGTLILSGTSTYDGLTTLSGGVLNIQNARALGSTVAGTIVNGIAAGSATNARLELEGGVTISGEALTINGVGNFTGALNSKSGSNVWAGNVTVGSVGTRIGSEGGATLTVSGIIGSAGASTGLVVRNSSVGLGVVVLSGANTYLGDTLLGTAVGTSVGVLRLANSNALSTGKLIINNGNADTGTVELIGGITIANNIDFFGRTGAATAAIIRNVSGDNELSGVLTGSFNGSSYNFHSDGGTLTISNRITSSQTGRVLTLRGVGAINITGVIDDGAGNMSVRTLDGGTYALSGANTYTSTTTVSGGILRVTSLSATGASSVGASDSTNAANLALNGSVRLEYAGTGEATSRSFAVTGSGLTLAASGSGALDFTSSANVAFATDGASARELRLAGSNTGDNTYAATAAGTPLAADVFRKIVKNEVGKWVVAGNGTTFADNLQVEVNAGLLAFGQASQLRAGSAVVNGGTLFVATGTNTGASVTVNNGGTLGGSASLGAVTVNNGGALSPGASPGVFTASSLSLAGGSIISWQVSDAFGAAGTGYDQLAVTGNLDLTGASSANKIILKIGSLTALDANGDPLNFGAPNGVASIRTFQFGQVGGVLLNNGVNISDVFAFDVDGFTYTGGAASNAALWSINWNSASGAITLTAVPEPSTYGLGLGALALAAAALRRRRKQAPAA